LIIAISPFSFSRHIDLFAAISQIALLHYAIFFFFIAATLRHHAAAIAGIRWLS